MKNFIATTALLTALAAPPAHAQSVSFKHHGFGCGQAVAAVVIDHLGQVLFRFGDPYIRQWNCGTNGSKGIVFVSLMAPSTQKIPLPSFHKSCLLHGSVGVLLPFSVSNTSLVLGKVPTAKFDVVVQGVIVLYTTGQYGEKCPSYLSATDAWRVWQ